MSGRAADATLMTRVRNLHTELVSLDRALQTYGDRQLGDAVKRARREIELSVRQGQFQSRGVNL